MEKKEKINIIIVIVGIFLILFVSLFFLIRPFFGKKDNLNETPSEDPAYVKNLKKAKKITGEDLRKRMLTEKNIIVIDIRDESSFALEHITDSINIPYSKLDQALISLDKTKTYVLVDSGSSFDAAYVAGGIFAQEDFFNVFYLSGGFIAWKKNIALTVSAGDPNSFTDQSKVIYISSDELKKIMEDGNNVFIVDVRPKDQFESGHLKNALNMPLDDLEKNRSQIPIGKKIILCDEDSFLAFQAGVRLHDLGFFNTRVLSDGLRAWKEKNYEIVK